MRRALRPSGVFLLVSAAAVGPGSVPYAAQPPATPVPPCIAGGCLAPPDTVYSGCGGGKTGGGSGLVVASSGWISRWRRTRAGAPRTIVSTWADSTGAAHVFRAVRAARFRSVPPGKPSNWTCFFRLVDSAGAYEVPYSGRLPPALREVDSLIRILDRYAPEP